MRVSHEWWKAPPANFAVVGDPVAHSLSPRMQAAAFEAVGLARTYVAVRVPKAEFAKAMAHLGSIGYEGVNVTVPLKEAAFEWCEGGDPRMGSVNTLRFEDRAGINTDAPGLLSTLAELGVAPGRALVLGAGGSARALAVGLSDAGFDVVVHNRTRSRAEELVERAGIAATVLDEPDPSGCLLILNTTSAGLFGQAPAVQWRKAEPAALAYDLLYGSGKTPFMIEAEGAGLKTVDGRRMLVAQGALSFEWWTGFRAPIEAMIRAIS